MKNIYNFLTKLNQTSSRLEKEDLLKSVKDNTRIVEVLRFLCDPNIVTGIATNKVNKEVKANGEHLNTIEELLLYLENNNTGSDENVATVLNFAKMFPDYSDTIKKIATKSFRLGLSSKTLNKIYGEDFIYTMEVQLAETYKEDSKKFPKGTYFYLTTKFDGFRCIYLPTKESLSSRNGKTLNGLNEVLTEVKILEDYLRKEYKESFILDGELLIAKTDKPKEEWFNETSKIVSAKNDNKTNIKYIIFDLCYEKEFYSKKTTLDYVSRRLILQDAFNKLELKHLVLAEILYEGNDQNKIIDYYVQAVENGEEGIMINLNEPYQCKRTHNLLKVKPVKSADLEIVGFNQGAPGSKYENTLGALVVDYKGTKVGVGSGLSDEMRLEIWNNQDKYLGKIAEIIYTMKSSNQNDESLNLRFPRFKTIRFDKTIKDINIEE